MLSNMMSFGDTVSGVVDVCADAGSLLMGSKELTLRKSIGPSKMLVALASVDGRSVKSKSMLPCITEKRDISESSSMYSFSDKDGCELPEECESD